MEVPLAGLVAYAQRFVESLPTGMGERAYIVGLSGELGAGKTAFVQEVARLLGVSRAVASPTYTIVQVYPIHHGAFARLVHVDAYRLKADDADTIGWKEYADDPRNLIVIEWPRRVPGGIPSGTRLLEFTVTGDDTRDIEEKTL